MATELQMSPEYRSLTVDDVYRMVEAGILDPDEHVELLDGVLLQVNAQGPSHRALTVHFHRRLERVYGMTAHLCDHSNLRLDNRNLPEPDVALVRGHELDYLHRIPTGDDVILVVEVSVTSQRRDLYKAEIYGRSGVPVYWRVDVPDRTITVHRAPKGPGYTAIKTLGPDDDLELPETTVVWRVGDVLPHVTL